MLREGSLTCLLTLMIYAWQDIPLTYFLCQFLPKIRDAKPCPYHINFIMIVHQIEYLYGMFTTQLSRANYEYFIFYKCLGTWHVCGCELLTLTYECYYFSKKIKSKAKLYLLPTLIVLSTDAIEVLIVLQT